MLSLLPEAEATAFYFLSSSDILLGGPLPQPRAEHVFWDISISELWKPEDFDEGFCIA